MLVHLLNKLPTSSQLDKRIGNCLLFLISSFFLHYPPRDGVFPPIGHCERQPPEGYQNNIESFSMAKTEEI